MSDDQLASEWIALNKRVEYHRQAWWREIQRWDDPPRVRVRKGRPGYRGICRDITIGDDGDVVWFPVDCGAD